MNINESCLITAIKQSKVLSNEEIERLKCFTRTRTYLLEQLPMICDEFNIQFNLRIVGSNGNVSTRSYGNSDKLIRLIVMFNHQRLVNIPDVKRKESKFSSKPKQSKFFFGYTPSENEFDDRMKELQNVM